MEAVYNGQIRIPAFQREFVWEPDRIAIFASFQTELPRPSPEEWKEVYLDYRTTPDPQDPSFFALQPDEADPDRFFPVRVLFDTAEYRTATEALDKEALRGCHRLDR